MRKADKKISRREMLKLSAAAGAMAATSGVLGAEKLFAGEEEGLPQIPRRVLGKTGSTIPILLFGAAVQLDPDFDPKIAEGLRYGLNYIDAADCYGGATCEMAVGNLVAKLDAREDVWITSKSDRHDPKGLEKTLQRGLEHLQTDYVDLYFMHNLKEAKYLSDDMRRMAEKLKKEGKIRYFGFSTHAPACAQLLTAAAEAGWIDAIMFRYNFRIYGEKELNDAMDECVKAGVGLIAMKTQGSEASFRDAWRKYTSEGRWTKHQAVLKAVWADSRITAAVSSMESFTQLRENIAAAVDREELGRADWEAIERYAAETRRYACDGCDHICNAAVDAPVRIGDTMRFLMYHEVYGEREKAKRLFAGLPGEAKRLRGVDFSGADSACPHGVDVAAHMARSAEVFNA